jgi:hypothetical protein
VQRRRFWLRLAKLSISVIFFLVMLELGIRLVAPVKRFSVTPNTWDPEVGIKQMPGARGYIACSEFEIEQIINAKGLRDRDYPYAKAPGHKRILCLGDSFTHGFGVAADETFAKVLERRLQADQQSGDTWEVINAGIGHTGTAHQLAFFNAEGYKYEPDLVVLAFCSNDPWDNVHSAMYSLHEGELVKHNAPKPRLIWIQKLTHRLPGFNTLFARSHLFNTIKYKATHQHFSSLAAQSGAPANELAALERRSTLTKHLLTALDRACQGKNCRLLVAIIPPLAKFPRHVQQVDVIANWLQTQNVQSLDLRPHFEELKEAGMQTNYPRDGHWNSEGHRVCADILFETISGL